MKKKDQHNYHHNKNDNNVDKHSNTHATLPTSFYLSKYPLNPHFLPDRRKQAEGGCNNDKDSIAVK